MTLEEYDKYLKKLRMKLKFGYKPTRKERGYGKKFPKTFAVTENYEPIGWTKLKLVDKK